MIHYLKLGETPAKLHTVLRDAAHNLLWEECFTRHGFDGAYSVLYHRNPPTSEVSLLPTSRGFGVQTAQVAGIRRRLFQSQRLTFEAQRTRPLDSRQVWMVNGDVAIGLMKPQQDDDAFLANNDGDELYFLQRGTATLQTPLGALPCTEGDYVWVPRSLPHRFVDVQMPSEGALWLSMEIKHGLKIPSQYLNESGQLRLDAPYSYRDFVRPAALLQSDEVAAVIIKRQGHFYERRLKTPLLDVVGFDGFVYPVAFNIQNYQPKVGLVHLPPTIHMTFAARGLIVCSFVPRPVDFHPQAIPCPYPHSSVDCDEVIFYCRSHFTSRKGVSAGDLSLHPAGIIHGPHPGAYEASIGTHQTQELAVMVDTLAPLALTESAQACEFAAYHEGWNPDLKA